MRKKIKAICAVVFAFIMSVQTFSAFAFWDVPRDYWAYGNIKALTEQGIVNGYEDGSFNPEGNVTRAEWAKMLFEAGNVPSSEYVHLALENADMSKSHWASVYMVSVNEYLPYYIEDGVNMYYPDRSATREEVTSSLAKYLGYKTADGAYNNLRKFSDGGNVSNGNEAYIDAAVEKGLINGYEDGTIKINIPVTRAEASAILCRAFGYYAEAPASDGTSNYSSDYSSYLGSWYYTPEDDRPLVEMNIGAIDGNTMSVSMERMYGKDITYVFDSYNFDSPVQITASGSYGFIPYGNEFTKVNYIFNLGDNCISCVVIDSATGETVWDMMFYR